MNTIYHSSGKYDKVFHDYSITHYRLAYSSAVLNAISLTSTPFLIFVLSFPLSFLCFLCLLLLWVFSPSLYGFFDMYAVRVVR